MKKSERHKRFQSVDADLTCEIKSFGAHALDHSGDMHNHTCHEIIILLDGELNLYTEYSGIKLVRGDVAMIPTYVFHRAELLTDGIYNRIVINVNEAVLNASSTPQYDLNYCFSPYNDRLIHSVHLEEEEINMLVNDCRGLYKSLTSSRAGSDILTDAYLKLIMVRLNTRYAKDAMVYSDNTMPVLVQQTFDYIDKHLTEEISLHDLERTVHHNGTYISRSLKKISGLSVSEYIIAKRIALACRLLREGKSASDSCYLSGFNNYSNFSRTFSKQVGRSPKQFQKLYMMRYT